MSADVSTAMVEVDGQAVAEVFEPESVDELTSFLIATDAPASIVIVGGGTRLAYGNADGPFDAAISLRRLNRVVYYEPDDMTLAVEPGCTVADIHALLADHNQAIALDTARPECATIGGSFATGMSSPRRLGGGSLKDWAIGIEVVLPDGSLAKAGGMVVKNVTGFDMMHVHYGALGAFGIVTRLNLKVFPQMSGGRSVVLRYDDVSTAHAAGEALLRSQLQPTSIVLDNVESEWSLRVRCDAPVSAIERVVERTISVATSVAAASNESVGDDANEALLPFLSVTDLMADRAVVRLPIPASRQITALRLLETTDGFAICADLGSGIIYAAGLADEEWLRRIEVVHPSPTFLALPVEMKRTLDVFGGVDPAALAVVSSMKDAFDPYRRFNRGRFVARL